MKFCNTESKHGYGYRGSSKISSSCCRAPAQPCFSSRLAAAFVSREAPSPSHIYFHGNPWKAFCSLKTTFALSSCKLALSRAECIPTALNEYKKKKKRLNLDGQLLFGRPYGRKEQATFKWPSVCTWLSKEKQSCFINWLTWRVVVIRIIILWSECGNFLKQLQGRGENGQMAGQALLVSCW